MTKRAILFKSRSGWFVSPEFIGDKTELAQSSTTYSCERDWTDIMQVIARVKTLDEFKRACVWAKGLYHTTVQAQKEADELRLFPITAAPDEMLVVYEDLGVTGIQTLGQCTGCGQSYPVFYRPDGTVDVPCRNCLSCGGKLRAIESGLPPAQPWQEAITRYKANKVYTINGTPAKIRKLVWYENGHFYYEMLLPQRHTAVYPDHRLESGTPASDGTRD